MPAAKTPFMSHMRKSNDVRSSKRGQRCGLGTVGSVRGGSTVIGRRNLEWAMAGNDADRPANGGVTQFTLGCVGHSPALFARRNAVP